MNEQLERVLCLVPGCEQEPREYWYLKTDTGIVERNCCYAHALDYRPTEKAAFGEAYIAGSDEGEA